MEIKKNPKSNLENFSKTFVLLGLVLSLYIVYVAIEHKTYDRVVEELAHVSLMADAVEDMVITEIQPPKATPPPPPPPPPPPKPEVFEKVDDDKEIEEVVIETTETEVDEVIEIDDIVFEEEAEEITYEDVPFAAISESAVFPGCEKKKDKKKCFSDKIGQTVNRKFDKDIAEENGLSGLMRIYCLFKVDYRGEIADVKIRAPHPALKAEAERVIKALPKMVPASQNGKPVNLLFTLPILFQVE